MARSNVNRMVDLDTSIIADPYTQTLTASGQVGADYSLDKMVAARGDIANDLGAQGYDVILAVTAIDTADANETYAFNVTVGDGTTQVVVGSIAGVGAVGQHIISVDAATAQKIGAEWTVLELDAVLGGTTPSITLWAWVDIKRAG